MRYHNIATSSLQNELAPAPYFSLFHWKLISQLLGKIIPSPIVKRNSSKIKKKIKKIPSPGLQPPPNPDH